MKKLLDDQHKDAKLQIQGLLPPAPAAVSQRAVRPALCFDPERPRGEGAERSVKIADLDSHRHVTPLRKREARCPIFHLRH